MIASSEESTGARSSALSSSAGANRFVDDISEPPPIGGHVRPVSDPVESDAHAADE